MLSKEEKLIYCIKCGEILIGNNQIKDLLCPCCKTRFCVPCEVEWHQNETCEAYKLRTNKELQEEKTKEELVKMGAKICPNENCGEWIIKNGGCNRMTCKKCQQSFCWLCSKLCGTPGATYEHIRTEHQNNLWN